MPTDSPSHNLQVEAIRPGYYGHRRRKKGDQFKISSKSHFSHLWMKALNFSPDKPRKEVESLMNDPHWQSVHEVFDPKKIPGAPDE